VSDGQQGQREPAARVGKNKGLCAGSGGHEDLRNLMIRYIHLSERSLTEVRCMCQDYGSVTLPVMLGSSTTPSRRERLRAQTLAEIREHAYAQIAQGGPTALSLNGIAKAMGMSGPALY